MISGDMGVSEIPVSGISTQWSSVKVPCLDQLDKAEAPVVPDTYAYSLVLTCLNSLSNDLSKTILPLSAQTTQKRPGITTPQAEESNYTESNETDHHPANGEILKSEGEPVGPFKSVLVNPLDLENNKDRSKIVAIAALMDNCWPAILAASSTFLYAALDAEFYRSLIRSMQKFTQIAGILRLSTPRDAFLTTLAKAAVPPNILSSDIASSLPSTPGSPRLGIEAGGLSRMDSFFSQVSGERSRRESIEISNNTLSQRNLMCLRALTNLAISLGSILETSWMIVVESLQKADNVLANSNAAASAREFRSAFANAERNQEASSAGQNMGSEITAVEAAVSRLFQSTADYPEPAFQDLMTAMCKLIPQAPPTPEISLRHGSARLKGRKPSASSMPNINPPNHVRSLHFAIAKLGEIARINIERLATGSRATSWEMLSTRLIDVATSASFDSTARLMAADVLGSLAVGLVTSTATVNIKTREEVQQRALACLENEVWRIRQTLKPKDAFASSSAFDVHRSALEALRTILEQSGDSLVVGWRSIFAIVDSAFLTSSEKPEEDQQEKAVKETEFHSTTVSPKITRAAFASVQLICSDFLPAIKKSRIVTLIDILSQFCSQDTDLNVSLTAVTLFWNLSDFLRVSMSEETDEFVSKTELTSVPRIDRLTSAAESGSATATWMILQRRLALLTADDRADVRNGVIQTVFRIIGNCGDQMLPNMWLYCLNQVVLFICDINTSALREAWTTEDSEEVDITGLTGTAKATLSGISGIFASHCMTLTALPGFEELWMDILQRFSAYVDIEVPGVTTATYNALTRILSTAAELEALRPQELAKVLALSDRHIPKTAASDEVLVEYLNLLLQLYPLVQESLQSQHTNQIATNIRHCAFAARGSNYVSDVDTPTDVQSLVIKSFGALRDDMQDTQSAKIRHLSEFVSAPFLFTETRRGTGPTYVAFAKQALVLLEETIVRHCETEDIFQSGAISSAFQAVSGAVGSKYSSLSQGRDPALWKAASTTATIISEKALPAAQTHGLSHETIVELWTTFLEIPGRISYAPYSALPTNDALLPDETFDLEALEKIRRLLLIAQTSHPNRSNFSTRWLDDPSLPDVLRVKHVTQMFQSSLIHDMDLEVSKITFQHLYSLRIGSVVDPVFNSRIRICYACFDELFNLASQDSGNDVALTRSLLAKEAFPYLILRCALPLTRYIADQPLRRHMPTPQSQRVELLYLLSRIAKLQCIVDENICKEIAVLPEAAKLENQTKQHLRWLLPLVTHASRWARTDEEIADALQRVVEAAHSMA